MAGVSVTIGASTVKAVSAFSALEKKAKSTAASIAQGFKERVGHKLFDGLASAAASVPQLLQNAVMAASDLNEELTKSSVVFGKAAPAMKDWAASSAEAFGLSQQAALKASGGFGTLFNTMGVAPEKAAEMSKTLVQLAGDMASFNNTSVDDAVTAIASAMRGESEPISRFGVLLNETTLKAQALADGIAEGKAPLDPMQKSMAAYGLILKQTTLAQGDFQRTSDGLANQMRIAQAQFGNAAAALGSALLPAVTDLTKSLTAMDLQGIGESMGKAAGIALKLAPAITAIGIAMIALKIGSFVASMQGKVAMWIAETAAIRANTAALAQNAGASATVNASKNARGISGGVAGGTMVAAAVGFQVAMMYADSLREKNDALEKSIERANEAQEKFNVASIKGSVTSRDEIAKTIAAINEQKTAIRLAAEEQAKATENKDTAKQIIADAELAAATLDKKAEAIKRTTDAQIEANAATKALADAKAAEQKQLNDSIQKYKELRAEYEKTMRAAKETTDKSGSLDDQKASNLAAQKEVKKTIRSEFQGENFDGKHIASRLDTEGESAGKAKEMESAIKLIALEKELAGIESQRSEESSRTLEARKQIMSEAAHEVAMLNAKIKGQSDVVANLEREAKIREEMARIETAGGTESERRKFAESLVDKRAKAEKATSLQDILAKQKESATGDETGKRANEIASTTGLDLSKAKMLADNESDLEKLSQLREQKKNMETGSTLGKVSSMQRIGGGGVAVDSGLNYVKQQADLQKQMVEILSRIDQKTQAATLDQ